MRALIVVGKKPVLDRENSLMMLGGLTLLERSLYTLNKAGVNDFSIICGPFYEDTKKCIEDKNLKSLLNLELFIDIEKIPKIEEHVLVVNHNVIFDKNIIFRILGKAKNNSIICVDSAPKYPKEFLDATKTPLNVGILLINKIDQYLLESVILADYVCPSDIKNYELDALDLQGGNWFKIETENDVRLAKKGIISKLSMNPNYQTHDPDFFGSLAYKTITRFLLDHFINTSITPNQISISGLMLSILAAYLFSFGDPMHNIIAGTFMTITIIFDYLDGMVARLKFKSTKFGGFLEHIIDPIGFYAIIFGMCYGLYIQTNQILPYILGIILVMSFNFSNFLNKLYKETFDDSLETLIQKNIVETKSPFSKIYSSFLSVTRQGLWLLIGAFFNIILPSFIVIILSATIINIVSIWLILKEKHDV